ncbi:MAG: hypothetical protein LBQ31_09980 [Bacteroidales bacterium]|jgi:hypothetical protein|nr:hypothetical protein [Bacteroidales bacterium]
MKKIYGVVVLMFLCIVSYAQMGLPSTYCAFENDVTDTTVQVSSSSSCFVANINNPNGTKFKPFSNQPVIYVRINLIFLQRDNGTGNFQENSAEHQIFFDEVIDELNYTYANLVSPNDGHDVVCNRTVDFIPNTKIQFIVNKIYWQDSYGWDNLNNPDKVQCPGDDYPGWHLDYIDNQIINDPSIPRGINIYFTENSNHYHHIVELQDSVNYFGATYACSQFPDYSQYGRTSKIHMPDVYSKYWWMKNVYSTNSGLSWSNQVREWSVTEIGKCLAHEIGHSLSLTHPNTSCLNVSVAEIMNNSAVLRNYFSSLEIGKMYASLSVSNVRTFVPNSTYLGVKTIRDIEQQRYNTRLYHSLNIADTASLTVTCNMIMPSESEIEVHGSLIINNANITSVGGGWKGIRVKSNGYLEITSSNISDYDIFVENGGNILINNGVFVSGNHNITVSSGGFICLPSGTVLNLINTKSVLRLSKGAYYGISSTAHGSGTSSPTPSSCGSLSITVINGEGSIIRDIADVYIQNQTIEDERYIGGKKIYVGEQVTNTQSYGPVLMQNNADVILDGEEIIFLPGFTIEGGASLEIKNMEE